MEFGEISAKRHVRFVLRTKRIRTCIFVIVFCFWSILQWAFSCQAMWIWTIFFSAGEIHESCLRWSWWPMPQGFVGLQPSAKTNQKTGLCKHHWIEGYPWFLKTKLGSVSRNATTCQTDFRKCFYIIHCQRLLLRLFTGWCVWFPHYFSQP